MFLFFLFFFLTIDLHFLTPAVLAQIFNPVAELVIPIEKKPKTFQLKKESRNGNTLSNCRNYNK